MPIEFKCQHCGKQLRTPDNSAGKQGRCPHCQNLMQIPTASTKQAEQAATDPFHDVLGPTQKPAAAPLQDDLFGNLPPHETPGAAPSTPQASGFAAGPSNAANPYSAPAYSGGAGYGGGSYRPHRGGMVLTLGIISLVLAFFGGFFSFCCCPFIGWGADVIALALAVPGAILGQMDLKAMKNGQMDPSGRGMTQSGMIMAIIGGALVLLVLILSVLFFFLNIGLQGMQMQNRPKF